MCWCFSHFGWILYRHLICTFIYWPVEKSWFVLFLYLYMCTQFIRNQVGTFIEIWRLRKPLINEQWPEGFKRTIFCLKPNFNHQQQMLVIFHPITGAVIPSSRKFWSGPLWNTVCLRSFAQRTLCFTKTVVTYLYQFFSWRSPPICGDVTEKAHIAQVFGHSGLFVVDVLGKVMEPFRGEVLLEEEPQWGWAL